VRQRERMRFGDLASWDFYTRPFSAAAAAAAAVAVAVTEARWRQQESRVGCKPPPLKFRLTAKQLDREFSSIIISACI